MKHIVVVIYDSITNADFDTQRMQPLLNRLHQETQLHVSIISYERSIKNAMPVVQNYTHPRISFHLLPQLPFIGRLTVWHAAWRIAKLLPLNLPYELIAHGPLAGWISLKTYDPSLCTKITVQAHNLVTTNVTEDAQGISRNRVKLWSQFQTRSFTVIERYVFSNPAPLIEVNSALLRTYIHEQYGARLERITVIK